VTLTGSTGTYYGTPLAGSLAQSRSSGNEPSRREILELQTKLQREQKGYQALQKRCKLLVLAIESLEQRNTQLKNDVAARDHSINQLREEIRKSRLAAHNLQQRIHEGDHERNVLNDEILRLQGEIERLNASYKVVVDSTKQYQNSCREELLAIRDKIKQLRDAKSLVDGGLEIKEIEQRLLVQQYTKQELIRLQQETNKLQICHMNRIESAIETMKLYIRESDAQVEAKVDEIEAVIKSFQRTELSESCLELAAD
jgi:chromosome segregation ATPase